MSGASSTSSPSSRASLVAHLVRGAGPGWCGCRCRCRLVRHRVHVEPAADGADVQGRSPEQRVRRRRRTDVPPARHRARRAVDGVHASLGHRPVRRDSAGPRREPERALVAHQRLVRRSARRPPSPRPCRARRPSGRGAPTPSQPVSSPATKTSRQLGGRRARRGRGRARRRPRPRRRSSCRSSPGRRGGPASRLPGERVVLPGRGAERAPCPCDRRSRAAPRLSARAAPPGSSRPGANSWRRTRNPASSSSSARNRAQSSSGLVGFTVSKRTSCRVRYTGSSLALIASPSVPPVPK